MKIDNIKEEVTNDMENLRRKNEISMKQKYKTKWKAIPAE
jgi:hypothetical protein